MSKEKDCACGEECNCTVENNCGCMEPKDDKVNKKEEKNKYKAKINELEEVVKELEEKNKYSQAELVNYRKRKDEETANYLKYANKDIILDIIKVVDNFERAIKLDTKDLTDELSKFLDGFKMMYASLVSILESYGVTEINAEGVEFNHNEHEALMTDKDESRENGIVLEVLLKGYKLKDRVIRPAAVRINNLD